ncbi:MAG: alpha-amylase [Ignavibacteria bacterium GWB2_35_6b]|nr:MAG: alpha-amylase [Ignavibacteria bacterium GWB2_35_6b]
MKNAIIFFSIIFMPFITNCSSPKNEEIPRVPEWAKHAVWYQIFPERFNNGDTLNDPKPIDMEGGWPYQTPEEWHTTPWTSDWYKFQPWEKTNGHDFYWNAGTRRYGGDLQGVLDKLDYLQELGITAIYFNPVFESPSLHKYDATMYHHIDNNFGPDPEGDRKIWTEENPEDRATWKLTSADKLFLKLIDELHKRNMKIIIDGVFNHVGSTFWAFKSLQEKQQGSKYKDWFTVKNWDDKNTTENEFDYEGWYGVKDLPEIKEDENGLVESFANHVHDVLKRWMDPNGDGNPSDGIDGWRLDVAEMVNINYWKKFRTQVKEINPDAYITGEIWWKDWNNNVMMNAAPWLQGDTFDAVMNYRFTRAVKKFIMDQKTQINASGFVDSLNTLAREYNKENLYTMMNLLGSHDVERLASVIVNPDIWYDHRAKPSETPEWDIRKPNERERMIQKLAIGIQMTMPGAPMIYYGDEAGMWGGDDPDCRKPMVWKELNYEIETAHPFGKTRPADEVKFNEDIFDWYKKLITIRKTNDVLSNGEVEYFMKDNDNKVLGYRRYNNDESIFIVVNNNDVGKEITLDLQKNKIENDLTDLITGEIIRKNDTGFSFGLQPYQIVILR